MSDSVKSRGTALVADESSPSAYAREPGRNGTPVKCRPDLGDVSHSVSFQTVGHLPTSALVSKRRTWDQIEGSPLPLGATWIEDQQAFNFAVHAEHAENVTLLLYSDDDLINPILTFQFDFLHNKTGPIWHCRVPLSQMPGVGYYGYSVSGQVMSELEESQPDKVLLDPYAKSVFFPPDFDRKLAIAPGPNSGKAPLAVLPRREPKFDWTGDVAPRPE